jgi:hypothetical protein
MEPIAQRNRDFLDSNFPRLLDTLSTPATSGSFTFISDPTPNIILNGRTIHSKRNPEREAHNLVHDIPVRVGIIVLFLGLGMGYQIEKLKRRFAGSNIDATLIVIERSTEIFSLLCRNREISFLRNTHLFIGDSLQDIRGFIEGLTALSFSGHRIVKLRGSYSLYRDYYDEVEHCFKKSMSDKISDLLTRYAFEALWMRNTIDNMPSFVGRRSITSLKGTLRGQPALVVNAGPSLLNQMELLYQIQNRIHLIAVDTALTPLLKRGISPDFVVTLDAGFYNSLDFRWLFSERTDCGNMKLVADIVTNPIILRHWKGSIFLSETSHSKTGRLAHNGRILPLFDVLHNHFPPIDTLACGGSISTTALELAMYLDADPVYTTALDLSYTDYKTHVNSSSHYDALYQYCSRLNTLDTAMVQAICRRKLMHLPAIEGSKPLSDFVFSQYIRWIEGRRAYRNRVINCTAAGAAIKGLPHVKIETLAQDGSLPLGKKSVSATTGRQLTAMGAKAFLIAMKDAVQKARTDMDKGLTPAALSDRNHVFHTIFAEAGKLYSSSESFNRHLALFLSFMERHIDRAASLIEMSEAG